MLFDLVHVNCPEWGDLSEQSTQCWFPGAERRKNVKESICYTRIFSWSDVHIWNEIEVLIVQKCEDYKQ